MRVMDTRTQTFASAASTTVQKRRSRVRSMVGAAIGFAIAAAIIWFVFIPDPIPVEIATVMQGPMQVTVNNQGQVRVHDRYIVAAPFAAELERIDLREGDYVQRKQVVATLRLLPMDARQRQEATARLNVAKALARAAGRQVQSAATDLQFAMKERERIERLVADKFMSVQAVDKAITVEETSRAALDAARSREQAANSEVQLAQAALLAADMSPSAPGRTLGLSAPVDGYVLKVHEKSARTVGAGTQLVSIADPAQYEVVVDVLSTDAVKIKAGDTMLLEEWGGGKTLRARVRLVEPVAFTKVSALGVEEQRVNVIADPVDPLGPLGDGYRIEARIVIWSGDQVLKVAGSSLFRVGNEWHVFAVADGRARETMVRLGQRNQDEAQILDGLAAGTAVIRYPNNQLHGGARVAPSKP